VIRLAAENDTMAIRDCAQQAYARYTPLIGREPAPMVADFEAQIADGAVHIAVDAEGAFQGYIVFFRENDHILLESVAVLPRAVGQGIGKALIRFCEGEGRRYGLAAIHLYTNERMTENLAIYPRLGYTEVARRIENGFNRVYFEKRLA
jgi:GNAT superfamily N-acetyltransferase